MPATAARRRAVGALLSAGLLLTGCGGNSHQPAASQSAGKTGPTSVSASSSPSMVSETDARQAVLIAYHDFMDDWNVAAANPQDQGAKLASHASGQALE